MVVCLRNKILSQTSHTYAIVWLFFAHIFNVLSIVTTIVLWFVQLVTLQIEHCNRPGRPRLAITQGQLEALQRDSGFSWSDVARIFCVSARTLRRRRHELGMLVEGRQFSELTDTELDDLTRQALQITPAAGLRMVQGYLRQRGLVVQRICVLHALRRVDPVTSALRNARRIIRRVYNVPSPNSLW